MQSLLGLCKQLLPFQIPTSPLSCQAQGQWAGLAGAQLALFSLSSLSCVLPWPKLGGGMARVGLLQSAHNQEEAGSQVTPQASSCRDGFEGCGVISPGWSRLSGKTSWRSSGGLGPQTGNLTAGLRHRCKAAGRWQLQVGLLLWQRTGSWETRVLGPQGGRETSSEATEKPKRGRPGGSPGDFSEPAGGLPSASANVSVHWQQSPTLDGQSPVALAGLAGWSSQLVTAAPLHCHLPFVSCPLQSLYWAYEGQ